MLNVSALQAECELQQSTTRALASNAKDEA
jgi:hypothetical protein